MINPLIVRELVLNTKRLELSMLTYFENLTELTLSNYSGKINFDEFCLTIISKLLKLCILKLDF